MESKVDVLVIGSGPAGLSAAIYAKRSKLSIVVVEKEYEGTGQIAQSERVDNYLGLPGIEGYELGERFLEHARSLGVEVAEADVIHLEQTPEGEWKAGFEDGGSVVARSVIYAAGASPRRLDIPGEETFLGKGVSFCAVCDGAFYKDKTVAVIGGGDTALDDALYLSKISRKVYLLHRRDRFRGAAQTEGIVRDTPNIELMLNTSVTKICGEQKVKEIVLQDGKRIPVDGVFLAIGQEPQTKLLGKFARTDSHGYVIAGEDGKTDSPGLFVAGDVREKPLRQVVTAVSDGANAAYSAYNYLVEKQEYSRREKQ